MAKMKYRGHELKLDTTRCVVVGTMSFDSLGSALYYIDQVENGVELTLRTARQMAERTSE